MLTFVVRDAIELALSCGDHDLRWFVYRVVKDGFHEFVCATLTDEAAHRVVDALVFESLHRPAVDRVDQAFARLLERIC